MTSVAHTRLQSLTLWSYKHINKGNFLHKAWIHSLCIENKHRIAESEKKNQCSSGFAALMGGSNRHNRSPVGLVCVIQVLSMQTWWDASILTCNTNLSSNNVETRQACRYEGISSKQSRMINPVGLCTGIFSRCGEDPRWDYSSDPSLGVVVLVRIEVTVTEIRAYFLGKKIHSVSKRHLFLSRSAWLIDDSVNQHQGIHIKDYERGCQCIGLSCAAVIPIRSQSPL